MRKLVPLFLLLTAGCPGLGQVAFDVDSSGQSQVQGSPVGGFLPAPPGFENFNGVAFSQSQQFQNNNTNKDHITSCRVGKLTLKVVSPAGGTLSFLSRIEFFIKTAKLTEVRIAEALSIPAGTTSIDLAIDDQQIAPYAKSDTFSITTKATGQQPSQNTTIEADLKLHIEANIL